MPFVPEEEFAEDAAPILAQQAADENESSPAIWTPFFRHGCSFTPSHFHDVMLNLIKNPNLNSSWLFRADILHDQEGGEQSRIPEDLKATNAIPAFEGFQCKRLLVRRLIPRSTQRDAPLDQTCIIYQSLPGGQGAEKALVIYLPHVSSVEDVPFYHPAVRGIAFLHEWTPEEERGSVSISFVLFQQDQRPVKLTRTALQLLMILHKHGQGKLDGYVKRVNHDLLVPQDIMQNRYTLLKQKYARRLMTTWVESTPPEKHVFEDLGIAAFLMELWDRMYKNTTFPGFVDIGCGNGLLVHILNQEGYTGWGFDARSRKSWAMYNGTLEPDSETGSCQKTLRQHVLVPSPIHNGEIGELDRDKIHDGRFPRGTFIVSNHADELTPWTPILAAFSDCPFIMIPCCSHDLTGSKYRAPAPKDKSKGHSAYASLVEWVTKIGRDCNWDIETEMLRIPSTRNTALVGRKKLDSAQSDLDFDEIIHKYGGAGGYFENAVKLVKTAREH